MSIYKIFFEFPQKSKRKAPKTAQEKYLRTIKSKYDDKSVIVIDGSDITKPASKALESLCMVGDGSTGEIKPGYLTMDAAVLSSDSKSPIGVYSRIYSTTEKGL